MAASKGGMGANKRWRLGVVALMLLAGPAWAAEAAANGSGVSGNADGKVEVGKTMESGAGGTARVRATEANRALRMILPDFNADGVGVGKVIDSLRDLSGANIVVNWKVLEQIGIGRDTPVTLQLTDITLRKALQLTLDQASPQTQLVFSVDSNVISITTQAEADKVLYTRVYVVDDLVMTDNNVVQPPQMNLQAITSSGTTSGSGGGSAMGGSGSIFTESSTPANTTEDTSEKRGADLATLITQVVRPEIWQGNGGSASVRYFKGKLIVTAPASVQEAIGGPMLPEGGQRLRSF